MQDSGAMCVLSSVTCADVDGHVVFEGACEACGFPLRAGSEEDLRVRFEHHRGIPVPPAEVFAGPLTVDALDEFPEFFLNGRGYRLANSTLCAHGLRLTGNCGEC